jgi:hypothetical protein
MRTGPVAGKKAAITIPVVPIQGNHVIVVLAVEGDLQTPELDALRLLLIALGLIDLANQTRVHGVPPLLRNRRGHTPLWARRRSALQHRDDS